MALPPLKLVGYDSCDALLRDLRKASPPEPVPEDRDLVGRAGVPDGNAYAAAPNQAPAQHSGTNAYEPDADEPDSVKTDGRRIVALTGDRLQIIDAATRTLTARLSLATATPGPYIRGDQLLLSGDRALVISTRSLLPPPGTVRPGTVPDRGPAVRRVQTTLTLVDLTGVPKAIGTMTVNGSYVDARQTGSTVRLVVRSAPRMIIPFRPRENMPQHLPRTTMPDSPSTSPSQEPTPQPKLDDWLPSATVSVPGAPSRTYQEPCDQVKRPSAPTGGGLLSVLTIDPAKGLGDPQPVSVVGDGQTVYGNGTTLYVAGSTFTGTIQTRVHRFDVGGTGKPRWVASGTVPGTLLNQYALSEYQGALRVATTVGKVSGVHILTRKDDRLTQVGQLDGLGRNERLYAVRYLGRIAYAVTFRQVDPLYELDLGDPAHPRALGELKINGYSSYLHPTPDGHLIGVGQDVTARGIPTGLLVSEFDGSTPPRRIASYTEKDRLSYTGMDPHAFLYWPATGLAVIPAQSIGTYPPPEGAFALTIDAKGIRPTGFIRQDRVRRAMVIGDTLWTFSDTGAIASGLTDLKRRAEITYPQP
ncbi:beta-propeller domain-containing protein [Actinomadura rupiterrae]|uniref:beta-propeller domain-containing protein n=1 Tax=Actinomadura rupiterrae TaxID=559627 RepID=UPI0020A41D97|nr:beta-propeller domain-containing protein [Actinomadura rupiterrae]